MDIGLAFGKVLRQKRKEAGLTQEQLALEADVQRNYVSLVERGIHNPTIAVLFKLANALRCQPSDLVSDLERMLDKQADPSLKVHPAEYPKKLTTDW